MQSSEAHGPEVALPKPKSDVRPQPRAGGESGGSTASAGGEEVASDGRENEWANTTGMGEGEGEGERARPLIHSESWLAERMDSELMLPLRPSGGGVVSGFP